MEKAVRNRVCAERHREVANLQDLLIFQLKGISNAEDDIKTCLKQEI